MSDRAASPAVSSPVLSGLASVMLLAELPSLLRTGGLAPLAVASVIAVGLGARAAGVEWRTPPPRGSLGVLRRSLAEAAGLGLVAGCAAMLLFPDAGLGAQDLPGGALALSIALGGWAAGRLLAPSARLSAALLGAVVLAAAADAFLAARTAAPWTLLEPHFESWRAWLPGAAVVGVLAAGAGAGPFTLTARVPGQWRAPWVAAALWVTVGLLSAIGLGSRFEATLGAAPSLVPTAVAALALAAAAGAVAGGRWRTVAALAATLWLAGPGRGAAPFVVGALAPTAAAGALSLTALAARGADRAWAAATAVVLLVAVWGGEVPVPAGVGEAVATGLLLVGVFWIVATRAVVAGRTA